MAEISRFNLRVYAVIIRSGHLLISEENINGFRFTKLPGGGVEHGEGLMDALKRELREEGDIELLSATHFYTTDFFQQSAFVPTDQVVSVYYRCETDIDWNEYESDQSTPGRNHHLRLSFIPLHAIRPDLFTFPIDKLVSGMIIKGSDQNL